MRGPLFSEKMNTVHSRRGVSQKGENPMQAIVETLFDIIYLTTVLTLGVRMVRRSAGRRQYRLFGWMAVVLGAGDAFHLAPRAVALCTTGLENYTAALGLGKVDHLGDNDCFLPAALCGLAGAGTGSGAGRGLRRWWACWPGVRILLCMLPQNRWLSADAPLVWGIWRNIPFALLGLVMILLFYRSAKETGDRVFSRMWLTIALSFGFYIPVVLWADAVPMVGMLMIPKTCAYVWTVLIGCNAMKQEL